MVRTNNSCRILYKLKRRRVSISGDFTFFWKKTIFKRYLNLIDNINPHIIITGQSGSGKSNAANVIIEEFSRYGYNFLVIDPKNDYTGIAAITNSNIINAKNTGINIFERGLASITEKSYELSNLFQRHLRLGHVQKNCLYRCIKYTYEISERKKIEPNFSSLLFTIQVFKKNAEEKGKRGEVSILENLSTRLSIFDYLKGCNLISISRILNERTIIRLDSLGTMEAQSIFMEEIIRQVYTHMISLNQNNKQRFYIIVDEAGKLGSNPVIGRIGAEGRKYGVGIIAISQDFKSLDKDLRCNSSLIFNFYTREPEELNYISSFLACGNDGERLIKIKSSFRKLRVGEALAMHYEYTDPIWVRFRVANTYKEPIDYLINEILARPMPISSIKEYLALKGLDRSEATLYLERAKAKNEVRCYSFYNKTEYDDEWYCLRTINSTEHDITLEIILRHLLKLGYYAKIHNRSNGPDIIAEKSNIKYAIEYETGLKSFQDSEKMICGRLGNFNVVIVICKGSDFDKYSKITNILCIEIGEFLRSNCEELENKIRLLRMSMKV
ncbi:MAG: ATP-binding protein [Candidatus Micrarchaeia archaeon]